jgi:hypothetical protein
MGALHTHNPVKTIREDEPSQALCTGDAEGGIRSEAWLLFERVSVRMSARPHIVGVTAGLRGNIRISAAETARKHACGSV